MGLVPISETSVLISTLVLRTKPERSLRAPPTLYLADPISPISSNCRFIDSAVYAKITGFLGAKPLHTFLKKFLILKRVTFEHKRAGV
jgi:hypothetical protein